MRMPGFLSVLQDQLASLSLETLERVNRSGGLEIRDLFDFLLRPTDYTVHLPYIPEKNSFLKNEDLKIASFWEGRRSLAAGETALCITTCDEVFKPLPSGTTPLEFHMTRCSWVKNIWVLSSPRNASKVLEILSGLGLSHVKLILQYESISLNPDNTLYLDLDGLPDLHDCGQGDLIHAIVHDGTLSQFLKDGGKNIAVYDGENMLGGCHPTIVGQHIVSDSSVTCEITQRKLDDTQGIFCEHAGYNQVVEKFRFTSQTDLEDFPLSYAGMLVFKADLDFSGVKWKWHRTKNSYNNMLLVQYKRSLYDLTAAFHTQFIETPRHYCYMPISQYVSLKSFGTEQKNQ